MPNHFLAFSHFLCTKFANCLTKRIGPNDILLLSFNAIAVALLHVGGFKFGYQHNEYQKISSDVITFLDTHYAKGTITYWLIQMSM